MATHCRSTRSVPAEHRRQHRVEIARRADGHHRRLLLVRRTARASRPERQAADRQHPRGRNRRRQPPPPGRGDDLRGAPRAATAGACSRRGAPHRRAVRPDRPHRDERSDVLVDKLTRVAMPTRVSRGQERDPPREYSTACTAVARGQCSAATSRPTHVRPMRLGPAQTRPAGPHGHASADDRTGADGATSYRCVGGKRPARTSVAPRRRHIQDARPRHSQHPRPPTPRTRSTCRARPRKSVETRLTTCGLASKLTSPPIPTTTWSKMRGSGSVAKHAAIKGTGEVRRRRRGLCQGRQRWRVSAEEAGLLAWLRDRCIEVYGETKVAEDFVTSRPPSASLCAPAA